MPARALRGTSQRTWSSFCKMFFAIAKVADAPADTADVAASPFSPSATKTAERHADAYRQAMRIGRRTGSATEASVAAPSAAMLSCNSRSGQPWLSVSVGRPARASRSDRKDRKLFVVPQGCCKPSGRGSAWLERLVRDQEVDGSNPFAPTTSSRMSDLSHTRNRKSAWCETKQPVRQISQLLP